MSDCTCTVTAPKTWTTYGSSVEPGSMMEPDPDCIEHFPDENTCKECAVLGDHTWWCVTGAKENDARPAGAKRYFWRD